MVLNLYYLIYVKCKQQGLFIFPPKHKCKVNTFFYNFRFKQVTLFFFLLIVIVFSVLVQNKCHHFLSCMSDFCYPAGLLTITSSCAKHLHLCHTLFVKSCCFSFAVLIGVQYRRKTEIYHLKLTTGLIPHLILRRLLTSTFALCDKQISRCYLY